MNKKILAYVALMLSVTVIAVTAFTISLCRSEDGKSLAESELSASIELNSNSDLAANAERPYCVLAVGRDRVSGLADVIMLISFDRQSKKACILQIPRDTYAEYGAPYFKINGIISNLGEEGACAFFERSLGIELDGYISLELDGFRAVVDAIGGVEMTLDKPLKYSDPEQGLYIDIPSGRQTLDGEKAEMLVRYRSGYVRGDLDRLDMQKRFLGALFNSIRKKVNPLNIYKVASGALPYVKTNIPPTELVSLGISALSLDGEDTCIATLPGEDIISEISGGSFYVASFEGSAELVESYFGGSAENFDRDKSFLHPTLEGFKKIYQKKTEAELIFLSELK